MDYDRLGPTLDVSNREIAEVRATSPLEASGQADDPLGDEAAFPSTWQSLYNVEPFTSD